MKERNRMSHTKRNRIILVICIATVAALLLSRIFCLPQAEIEKSVWKDLKDIGGQHGLTLEEYRMLDQVKADGETYVLAFANYNDEEQEKQELGLSGIYLYAFSKNGGKLAAEQIAQAEKSQSPGYNTNTAVFADKKILFGNLNSSRYNGETDRMEPVSYRTAVVQCENGERETKDVNGREGYVFVLPAKDTAVEFQLLDEDGNKLESAKVR